MMNIQGTQSKRLIVLALSFITIIAYGYAVGGAVNWLMGHPKPKPVFFGIVGGTLCAFAALKIWRLYLNDIEEEDRQNQEQAKK